MADPLYELLTPYFENETTAPSLRDAPTSSYLARLSTLSYADLTSVESSSLLQAAQSAHRSLQALSKRSHKAVIASSSHLSNLSTLLPTFNSQARALNDDIPLLESAATEFAQKYDRSTENAVLDRRKRTALLSRNVDRVSDVLDLPSLLSSTVTAAQTGAATGSSTAGSATSYATALDLHAHNKRLRALYPQSDLVGTILKQSEEEMQNLASILITSLQSPSLKLAAAMRTIGLLRRVAPELAEDEYQPEKSKALSSKSIGFSSNTGSGDGALGCLFLVCRLYALNKTLEALDPLRDLADQETAQRIEPTTKPSGSSGSSHGSQSERFLKRYLEIYREQSFNILSMYKNIFPSNLPDPEHRTRSHETRDPLLPFPSPISSFALHLVDMLEGTLREYMPNVTDTATRESLLTQVLYCAGSLGRLGAEFGMMIALLEEDLAAGRTPEKAKEDDEQEWVRVMKKHRVQASRLEVLARGVGGGQRKSSMDVQSPPSGTSPTPTPLTAV
ncbi:unnamed protein product [Zymoseptoria tritici ST99CH_1A5]|uniref:Conserved oligomeric Golgi complex subunit 8 n=1 Tax=Zymoseptoria tritici ST99CH_1A5 TaxID=1276529 RepID=A0A1Y6L3U5_ZYMTR|nr:unnamed protein product [Zymoseptoria tritici ST99CH_1A5]